MRLFAASVASVIAIQGVLYLHPSRPGSGEPLDVAIALFIGATLFLSGIVMITSRRSWTFRGVGIFWATIGSGIFYLLVGTNRVRGESFPPGTQEFILDLTRSTLIVGGPAFLVGIIFWTMGHFGPQRDILVDVEDERRHMVRRKEDRVRLGMEEP
jgi:hypothetical protein